MTVCVRVTACVCVCARARACVCKGGRTHMSFNSNGDCEEACLMMNKDCLSARKSGRRVARAGRYAACQACELLITVAGCDAAILLHSISADLDQTPRLSVTAGARAITSYLVSSSIHADCGT